MILTITPNPAFDRVQTVPAFHPGRVCRSTALTLSAAGKGINVARAIRSLSSVGTHLQCSHLSPSDFSPPSVGTHLRGVRSSPTDAICTGFLGGHTGHMLADYAERDGILADWTWIEGETRVSIIILAPETGEITVLNEEGPTVTLHDWERLQTSILALAAKTSAICLSGTLPPGLPSEVISTLIKALNRDKRRVFVDSSGAPLQAAVAASPEVIKINNTEAATLLGWHEFDDSDTAAKAAKAIQCNGISKVIITLGANGAVLANDSGLWHATPPPLTIVSPIGSGDSFLAGLTLSLLQDMPPHEALRHAVAAGSANALSAAGGNFSRKDFDRILTEVTITKR